MALYFIRHGQTDYNAELRFQGRADIPLNCVGRQQALRLRQFFRSESISLNKLVSSPLSRAVETAQIIADSQIETVIEPDFIEIDLGQYDGRLEHELKASAGSDAYDLWRDSCFTIAAPEGESMDDARRRVRTTTEKIRIQSLDSNIGIVAHQGVLMAIKSVLSELTEPAQLREFRQANDEIDIWNGAKARRIKSIRLEAVA